jgi:hypothetical protein
MEYSQIKRRIANYDEKGWTSSTYAINNEFGIVAIVYADHEQDALDAAVDNGKLDSQLMSDADYKEYMASGGGQPCYAGNAGEPIWAECLCITLLKGGRK